MTVGTPGQGNNPLAYADSRLNNTPVISMARAPTETDNTYPLMTQCLDTSTGDMYQLYDYLYFNRAQWRLYGGGAGDIQEITGDDGIKTFPNAGGNTDFVGVTVANATHAKPLYIKQGAVNQENWEIQVGAAITGSPLDNNDAGVVSFDDTSFAVDANGYVTLITGGGPVTQEFDVDFATPPGTDPTLPDATGAVAILGNTVTNATNLNAPVATHARAANQFNIDVQLSTAITGAPLDFFDAGLASFDDTVFTVDGNGFVSLVGGSTPPTQSYDVDFNTAPGTDPVLPDATGLIAILGNTVTNGTNANAPVATHSRAANQFHVDVQLSTAITGAPADPFDVGLASFDDTVFTVDANGYVSLTTTGVATTITGDSGGALSPTANNWNILGLSGSKTSGSGSTLTVKSPPYADSTATTLTVNSGTYATAAGAYVLPAAPQDGDLVEIICITTGIVVTANAGQEIQIAGDVTSTAGTATNSAKGDVLVLRYRETDTAWYATSSPGIWVLA